MPTLLELLMKGSAPPPPSEKPPQLPEPLKSVARAMEVGVKALQPAVEMTTQVMHALQAPARGLAQLTQALQKEPWKSTIEGIVEFVRTWPTDPYGRLLELEEFNYGFAVADAVEKALEAPRATDRDRALDEFLLKGPRYEGRYHKLGLGLHARDEEVLHMWRVALLEIVTEQLKKPIYENEPWFFDSEQCRERLCVEMIGKFGRTRDLWEDRKIEDDPWTATNLHKVRKKKKERLPNLCEFDPEKHAAPEEGPAETVGLTNADLMEMLTEFQKREQEKFYLRQLEGLLPEQELRVLSLKVEHPTWTRQQIADELKLSKSTVTTYVQRTRERAKEDPEFKELIEGLI